MQKLDRLLVAFLAAGVWTLAGVLIFGPTSTSAHPNPEDCEVYIYSLEGTVYVYDGENGELTDVSGYGEITC